MLIKIDNTHDGYADLTCSEDDLEALKILTAKIADLYYATTLFYDEISQAHVQALAKELASHHDIPVPLEKHHVRTLLLCLQDSTQFDIEGVSKDHHRQLVEALSVFDYVGVFYPERKEWLQKSRDSNQSSS